MYSTVRAGHMRYRTQLVSVV